MSRESCCLVQFEVAACTKKRRSWNGVLRVIQVQRMNEEGRVFRSIRLSCVYIKMYVYIQTCTVSRHTCRCDVGAVRSLTKIARDRNASLQPQKTQPCDL